MSKRESVKMNEQEVAIILAPITRDDLNRIDGVNKLEDKLTIIRRERISKVAMRAGERIGFYPQGYGMWNTNIIKKDGEFYVEWDRSETCD